MLRIALFWFAAMLMGGKSIELSGTNDNEKDGIADNNVSLAELMSVDDGITLADTGVQPNKKGKEKLKGEKIPLGVPDPIHPNNYDGWDHPARVNHNKNGAVEKSGQQYRAHIDVHPYNGQKGLDAEDVRMKIQRAWNVRGPIIIDAGASGGIMQNLKVVLNQLACQGIIAPS